LSGIPDKPIKLRATLTIEACLPEGKMQTLLVNLILVAAVGAVFLIALRGGKDEKGCLR
jgi:hypothetical protein